MTNKTKKAKKDYTFAIGRKRTSSARVRLHKGRKESLVNEQVIGLYFPGVLMRSVWQRPFVLTGTTGKYYVTVKVSGGGKDGQLGAVVHGIARALAIADRNFRVVLKAEGLLTRDARKKQRRMVGTGGKSRRAKQSPKR